MIKLFIYFYCILSFVFIFFRLKNLIFINSILIGYNNACFDGNFNELITRLKKNLKI